MATSSASAAAAEQIPQLRSVSILHRHGSRGPGKSELDRLAATNPGKAEWEAGDIENITRFGHLMCQSLGKWFAEFSTAQFGEISREEAFWRCSSAARARESGDDFVTGLNAQLGYQLLSSPTLFSKPADMYFRPWKLIEERVSESKAELLASAEYKAKVEEQLLFLEEIGTAAQLKDAGKPDKVLWSMTHLLNVLECEDFWLPLVESSAPNGPLRLRHSLMQLAGISEHCPRLKHIEELACWIWDRRFMRTSYSSDLGGRLAIDIFTQTTTPCRKISVFSAHDYTLMGLMAALGVSDTLLSSMCFASLLLFELWDGPPPPFDPQAYVTGRRLSQAQTEAGTGVGADVDMSSFVVRLVLNPRPIDAPRSFDPSLRTAEGLALPTDESGRPMIDPSVQTILPVVGFEQARVVAEIGLRDFQLRVQALAEHFEKIDAVAGPVADVKSASSED